MDELKKHRRGDVREDGMMFWSRMNSANSKEWWVTPEKFKEYKESHFIKQKKRRSIVPSVYTETRRQYLKRYNRNKQETDKRYRLTKALRCAINNGFRTKGFTKKSRSVEIIGCSYEKFEKHIESLFQEGMTWENRGVYGWHIDHIIPVCTAITEEDLIKLNHYTNLRPLWAKDNLKKGSKLPHEFPITS
jgi:hypothetical protein